MVDGYVYHRCFLIWNPWLADSRRDSTKQTVKASPPNIFAIFAAIARGRISPNETSISGNLSIQEGWQMLQKLHPFHSINSIVINCRLKLLSPIYFARDTIDRVRT